ncbi:hypothetical protein SAMN05216559_0411 [Halomicrobium zhouii]|uniref:Uncharacterized protein n=1 Tax=Halomicrobium zhouii TaxID=767519 RepID=A0A1I6K969_9EURY|nr:hypothetical protein [Halomicrobium zhouii]SFR87825.1 hypothetical protein SAMN05216559_0411 [Halomicrobium zhouii]
MQSQTRVAVLQSILLVVTLSLVGVPALAGTAAQSPEMDGTVAANAEANATDGGNESLAGETVTLHVSGGEGTERVFSFHVNESGGIEGLERGAREDATVTLRTDEKTFERIAHASDPERAFRTAIERGDVETRIADDAADAEWDVFESVEELARSLGL